MIYRIKYIIPFLALISCSQVQEDPKNEETPETNIISGSDIKEFLKPQEQSFLWSGKNDTIITCEKGTKIYLPKNCLDKEKLNLNEDIEIKITEFYNLSDYISEDLTTISGDKILETGGMINIRLHQNEIDLVLKTDQEFAILFPRSKDSKESMSTFYGERNSNNLITWEPSEVILPSTNEAISPETLTSCIFKQTSRTAAIGDEDVGWKIIENGEYAPDYIERNIKPSQKMIDDFCDLKLNPRYKIQYDKSGRVRDIQIETPSVQEYDNLICNFIKTMPKIDMNSMPKCCPDMYYELEFEGWERTTYDNEAFKKKFESKYSALKNEVVKNIDKAELNYYILTASKFGWINCDRFWNTDDEKIDFLVEIENIESVNLSLVFTDINSIMPAVKDGNKYLFKNIPLGRKVKLVGVGDDGEFASMAVSTTTVSKTNFNLSGFKNFKLSELEKELNSI